jgi:hypothetical protein
MSEVALHGGGAAKVSGYYEEAWTFFALLDMLAGLASAIQLEPPGAAGVGFEFWLSRSSCREWHQVKFQNTRLGKWTLEALKDENVLEDFKAKLRTDATAACLFVSAHSAFPLARLCAGATRARSLYDLTGVYLSNEELREAFTALRDRYWKPANDDLTWELLRRIRVRTIDRTLLSQFVEERIRALVAADHRAVLQALREVVEESLYDVLEANELRRKLAAKGCPERTFGGEAQTVEDAIRAHALEFVRARTTNLINGTFIAREELEQIHDAMADASPPHILITGEAGSGKSQVIAQVVERAMDGGQPVLALDVSGLSNETDAASVGAALGLPDAPATSLAIVARDRKALLAVDAVDSASTLRGRPITLFGVVGEVLRQARAHPNVVVVVACRSADLENDDRLRDLVAEHDVPNRFDVPDLSVEQVAEAVTTAGFDSTMLSTEQLALVQNPYNLSLMLRVADGTLAPFETAQDLETAFLAKALER